MSLSDGQCHPNRREPKVSRLITLRALHRSTSRQLRGVFYSLESRTVASLPSCVFPSLSWPVTPESEALHCSPPQRYAERSPSPPAEPPEQRAAVEKTKTNSPVITALPNISDTGGRTEMKFGAKESNELAMKQAESCFKP